MRSRVARDRAWRLVSSLLLGAATFLAPPDSARARDLPEEPDLFRQTLPNGLRVLVRERPGSDVVALSVGIRGGSRDEDDVTVGAAHFMEHMFFQGTPRRPDSADLDREVEALGGWINAWTSWESINFQVVVPSDGFEVGLDLIADLMANATFAEEKVEKERRVVLEELNGRLNAPPQRATDLFFREVFGDHPARNLPIGNRQTVGAVTRDVLVRFRDTYFVAPNMALAVVGDLDHETVFQKAADAFSGLRTGPVPPPRAGPKLVPTHRRVEATSPGQQARLILGNPAAGSDSPDKYALTVVEALLGPAGRRLASEIVDRRSLASTVDFSYIELTDVGLWAVDVGTRPENVDQVVDLIRDQIRRIRDGDVDDEALGEAKAYLRGRALLERERSVDLAVELADGTVLGYYEPLDSYLARIEAVSLDDVRRVASSYLDPDAYTLVVLKPSGSVTQ